MKKVVCPKCGSNKVQVEQYSTYVVEVMEYKHMCVVKCEVCGHAARHESYNKGHAAINAKLKFKAEGEEV